MPRRLRLVLALALLAPLLAMPSAGAAEPTMTDAAGDVVLVTGGDASVPPVPASGVDSTRSSDLLALVATETDDAIALQLTVASLGGTTAITSARTELAWAGGEFDLFMTYLRDGVSGVERASATLARLERGERGEREIVARFPLAVDAAAGTLATQVPKVYLVDKANRTPGRGDVLELRHVEASTNVAGTPFGTLRAYDRMPDAEGAPALLTLERGDFAQGDVVLSATDRVRVSNGGATTFVFQAGVRNTAEAEVAFDLALEDVPDAWNASVQSPVKVPAGEERVVSVLVSVPFGHEHGGYSAFNLTAASQSDGATRAKMRMGVLHTPIPQPAGHHAELYLHAEERDFGGAAAPALNALVPVSAGWMNTVADHAEDGAYVTPNAFGDDAEWWIPLNPSLQLGLDFDVEKLGEIRGSVLGKRTGDAALTATLYYEAPEGDDDLERVVLAEADTATVALDLQTPTPFALTLTPTPESDYIAYRSGARMMLVVALEGAPTDSARTTTLDPQLMVEDFVMTLPLNEYHDRLTGLAEAAASLEILARGDVEKTGLPGSVLTYPFTIRNGGPTDVFVIDLAGNHAHDGIAVPDGIVSLATGEERDVTLAVEIPLATNEGEELEVLLFVHGRDDPSKMAIARTKTRVTFDATEAHADEARLLLDAQARENETPLAPLLAILAIAAAAARMRRPTS